MFDGDSYVSATHNTRQSAWRYTKNLASAIVAVGICGIAGTAQADANLVQNGGFESTPLTESTGLNTYPNVINDWTISGRFYAVLYFPGDNAAPYDPNQGLYIELSTPAGASAVPTSPAGGNFLAQDGVYGGGLSQTINNLTINSSYTLSFYQGLSEQSSAGAGRTISSNTTGSWNVSFGSDTQVSPTLTNAPASFTGWSQVTMSFVAHATSEVLSFSANGTGDPPFMLLDGLNLTAAVPEPTEWALFAAGLLGLGVVRLRRQMGH